MGKYGDAAVRATKLCHEGIASNPESAWVMAVAEIFPGKNPSQDKSCPRNAYLGLCEAGAVSGIPKGSYCRSVENKGYALKALRLLNENPTLANSAKILWQHVMEGKDKKPNQQMDVVISMWNAGLIRA